MNVPGRHVVLGVSGGVAAYKAVEVCRRLMDAGAFVSPILTRAATEFVGAATFSALASEPARVGLFDSPEVSPHTDLAKTTDLILVVPATAHLLSAYATGSSSGLLTATLLATRAPVIVCPAMHTEMWQHPAVQDNVATLRRRGTHVVPPGEGHLAGGDIGPGRLADLEDILDAVDRVLGADPRGDLAGLRIVITAGGTREPLDPVRFLGNRSTGKQGHALADVAAARGAKVRLITTAELPVAPGVEVVRVETAEQMRAAVNAAEPDADVVIMSAAVADFRPAEVAPQKIKKAAGVPALAMERTVDILAELATRPRPGRTTVGFSAETQDVVDHASRKLVQKKLDLIVANDVAAPDAGFAHDTNEVIILCSDGRRRDVPLADKAAIASVVLDEIVRHRTGGAT